MFKLNEYLYSTISNIIWHYAQLPYIINKYSNARKHISDGLVPFVNLVQAQRSYTTNFAKQLTQDPIELFIHSFNQFIKVY